MFLHGNILVKAQLEKFENKSTETRISGARSEG